MNFLKRLKDSIGINRKIGTYTGGVSSLSSAYISLKNKLNLKSTGRSAICIKNKDNKQFNEMVEEINKFLDARKLDFELTHSTVIDHYKYLWFIIAGKTLEDILAATMLISDTVEQRGFSDELLACVFDFNDGNVVQYLIYSYKLHKFYPFVPTDKQQNQRDHSQELKIMSAVENEVPFENDMSNWYPIWDIPN
jgi:hypothetical protein